jgi:hypothetical protein
VTTFLKDALCAKEATQESADSYFHPLLGCIKRLRALPTTINVTQSSHPDVFRKTAVKLHPTRTGLPHEVGFITTIAHAGFQEKSYISAMCVHILKALQVSFYLLSLFPVLDPLSKV